MTARFMNASYGNIGPFESSQAAQQFFRGSWLAGTINKEYRGPEYVGNSHQPSPFLARKMSKLNTAI